MSFPIQYNCRTSSGTSSRCAHRESFLEWLTNRTRSSCIPHACYPTEECDVHHGALLHSLLTLFPSIFAVKPINRHRKNTNKTNWTKISSSWNSPLRTLQSVSTDVNDKQGAVLRWATMLKSPYRFDVICEIPLVPISDSILYILSSLSLSQRL